MIKAGHYIALVFMAFVALAVPAQAQTTTAQAQALINSVVKTGGPIITGPALNSVLTTMLSAATNPANIVGGFFPSLSSGTLSLPGSVGGSILVPGNTTINGVYATGDGAQVDLCHGPGGGYNYGCPAGGIGSILGQFVQILTTSGDASIQETGVYSVVFANTGYASIYAPSTNYNATDYTVNGPNLYRAAINCTSAASGGGPTGTTPLPDGTCSWTYAGPQYLRAKQAVGFITQLGPNAGNGWGIAGGCFPLAGWHGQGCFGGEIDATNPTSTDADGNAMTIDGLLVAITTGINPVTRGIHILASDNGTSWGMHDALLLSGNYLAKDNDIRLMDLHSGTGFADQGAHTTSSIVDTSVSPTSQRMLGTYSTAALFISPNSASTSRTAVSTPTGWSTCFGGFTVCESSNGTALAVAAPLTVTGNVTVNGLAAGQNGGLIIGNGDTGTAYQAWEEATVTGANGSHLLGYELSTGRTGIVVQHNVLNNDFILTTGGAIFGGTITASALPTSGATAKGSACFDVNGLLYVKTTTGPCV